MDNMSLLDVIRNRSSCRSFKEKEISKEIMETLLEISCLAPSSGGFQQYSIIKIEKKETLKILSELCRNQTFISKAPVSLVFCIDFRRIRNIKNFEKFSYDNEKSFKNFQMAMVDVSISAHNVCLVAETFGLSSVYIGNILDQIDEVSNLLKLPEYVVPAIMLTIGYPKNKGKISKKYGAEVIVHDENYHDYNTDKMYDAYKEKYKDWKMKIPPYSYWFDHYYKKSKVLSENEYMEYFKNQGFFFGEE